MIKSSHPNIENRLRKLESEANTLAAWYRRFRPSNTVLRISPADWQLLANYPRAALRHNFQSGGIGNFTFGEFQVLPSERADKIPVNPTNRSSSTMSLIIQQENNYQSEFKVVPAGTHLALCNLIADLGVQPDSQFKPRPKLYLRWELPELATSWHDSGGNEHTGPMMIGKTYGKSLAPKSILRRDVECWRGRTFSEAELKRFDTRSLLGLACMVDVVHRLSGDKTYADVATVMGAREGAAPQANGKLIVYDLDTPDPQMFVSLPGWLQQKIRTRVRSTEATVANSRASPEPKAVAEFDDDIPF